MARLQTLACLVLLGSSQDVLGQTNSSSSSSSSSSSNNNSDVAPVTSMHAGSFHTVVIINDAGENVVKDWGANGKGQLGLNDTKDRGDSDGDVGDLLPEVNIGNGRYAVQITAGLRHTAAILDDQTVRGWGYNAKGQLGVGTVESVGDEQNEMGDNMAVTELGTVDEDGSSLELMEIQAGGWHTCAIFEGDLLKCWGYNQWGELGQEDKEDRGDSAGEMGDDLPFVDVGGSVAAVALGDWHTCALLTDGDVVCFGKNFAGQLGLGDTENRGDEPDEMGYNLPRVSLGDKKATSIACGEEHSCAILEDGELRCWGLGESGQLGQGNRLNLGDEGGEMQNMAGIDLGTGRTAVQVTAGGNHTCALLDNGDVKCWGENDFGELGQGDTLYRGVASGQMGDSLAAIEFPSGWSVSYLSVGYYHSCAMVEAEDMATSVACWGSNENGQLGLGITETENIGDEEGEMGENLEVANLGGSSDDSSKEVYEEIWFYIVVIGAVLVCCCLVVLVCRAHRDTGGSGPRGPQHYKTGDTGTPAEPESSKTGLPVGAATGRPLGGYAAARSQPKKAAEDAETGTVAESPNVDAGSKA